MATHRVEIVVADPGHIAPVAANLRPADRAEIWASGRYLPAEALARSLSLSPVAWAGLLDGRPVCLFGAGAVSLLGGVGSPWLLGTTEIDRQAIRFLRRSRPMLARMLAVFPLLTNHVDARNALSIRWLCWLGFRLGPAEPWGPDGLPFHPFTLEG